MGRLQDKVCIITGATGGQGKVAVELFAKEGAKIVASDLDEKGDTELSETLGNHPDRVVYVPADVTREVISWRMVAVPDLSAHPHWASTVGLRWPRLAAALATEVT